MLSLQPRSNLHKKKPKVRTNVSNESKYVKVKRYQLQILLKKRTRQGTDNRKSEIDD